MKVGRVKIPEQYTEQPVFQNIDRMQGRIKFWQRIIGLLCVSLVLALAWSIFITTAYFTGTPDQAAAAKAETQINTLSVENEALKSKVGTLEKQIEELETRLAQAATAPAEEKSSEQTGSQAEAGNPTSTPAVSGTVKHVIKNGESLWVIAEKYYNDGFRYKEIMEQNALNDPNLIVVGEELTILTGK